MYHIAVRRSGQTVSAYRSFGISSKIGEAPLIKVFVAELGALLGGRP